MTMKRICDRRAGSIALCAVLFAWGGGVEGQQATQSVEELVGYHVIDGGYWRQDNLDSPTGDGAPTHWVRQVDWGPARDVVIADAFAVYEDGRCESIAHMVYYWDARHSRVALGSFNAGGVVADGYLESLGPDRTRLVATVRLPDGNEMQIRDTSDHLQSGQYSTSAERWVEGEWVAGDTAVWRAEHAPNQCR